MNPSRAARADTSRGSARRSTRQVDASRDDRLNVSLLSGTGIVELRFSTEFADRRVYEQLLGVDGDDLFTLKQVHRSPVPCPPIWRHPIGWLKWNPLLETRTEATFYDCKLEPLPRGTT